MHRNMRVHHDTMYCTCDMMYFNCDTMYCTYDMMYCNCDTMYCNCEVAHCKLYCNISKSTVPLDPDPADPNA